MINEDDGGQAVWCVNCLRQVTEDQAEKCPGCTAWICDDCQDDGRVWCPVCGAVVVRDEY